MLFIQGGDLWNNSAQALRKVLPRLKQLAMLRLQINNADLLELKAMNMCKSFMESCPSLCEVAVGVLGSEASWAEHMRHMTFYRVSGYPHARRKEGSTMDDSAWKRL